MSRVACEALQLGGGLLEALSRIPMCGQVLEIIFWRLPCAFSPQAALLGCLWSGACRYPARQKSCKVCFGGWVVQRPNPRATLCTNSSAPWRGLVCSTRRPLNAPLAPKKEHSSSSSQGLCHCRSPGEYCVGFQRRGSGQIVCTSLGRVASTATCDKVRLCCCSLGLHLIT